MSAFTFKTYLLVEQEGKDPKEERKTGDTRKREKDFN